MNTMEAKALLKELLDGWRRRPFAELVCAIQGGPVTGVLVGEKGDRYQFEIQVFCDGRAGGNIRVVGAIDNGGLRAFFPLTDGFIVAHHGSFAGEGTA